MRIIAACALALMLGSCAEEHKPFVPTTAQSDAVDQYSLCLWKAAKASDDHISDAATIGLAILPMCAGRAVRGGAQHPRQLALDSMRMPDMRAPRLGPETAKNLNPLLSYPQETLRGTNCVRYGAASRVPGCNFPS